MRRYNAFEEPGTFLHRLATKPIRPFGDTMRNTSEAMTDAQPLVAQMGDMTVDALSPAIETGVQGMLGSISAGLKGATPAIAGGASALAGGGGAVASGLTAAGATSTVPGVGPVAAPLAGAGAALAGGAGSSALASSAAGLGAGTSSALASFGADALAAATPALSKLAAPALKTMGRLGYSNLNNAVDKTATVMGSYDDNPATSRGLRALNNAQNPIAKPSSFSGFGSGTPGAGGTAKPSALSSLAGRAEMAPPIDVGAKNIAQPRAGMSSPRGINGIMFAPEFTPAAPQARKPSGGGRSAPAPRRQDWGDAKNSVPSQGLGSSPSAIRRLVMPESAMPDTISSNISSSTPGTASVPGMPPPAPSSAVNTDMRKLVMAQQLRPGFSMRPETEDSAAARLPDMPMPSQRQPPTLTPTGDAGPRPDVPFTPAQDTAMGALVRGGNTMSGPNLTDELQQMSFREPMGFAPVDAGIDYGIGGLVKTAGTVAGKVAAPVVKRAGSWIGSLLRGSSAGSNAAQSAFDEFAARNAPVSSISSSPPAPVSFGPKPSTPAAISYPPTAPRPVSMAPPPGGAAAPPPRRQAAPAGLDALPAVGPDAPMPTQQMPSMMSKLAGRGRDLYQSIKPKPPLRPMPGPGPDLGDAFAKLPPSRQLEVEAMFAQDPSVDIDAVSRQILQSIEEANKTVAGRKRP